MSPAPARSTPAPRRRVHARSSGTVARPPRRVSGPVAHPHRRPQVVPAPRGATTSIFVRVRALPDLRVVDRLLRSRAWIWALALLLGGIVAMQVSLLKLNTGISRAVTTTSTLERQNGDLEAEITRLSASGRVQQGAATLDMIMPAAGDVGYVTSREDDARRALREMTAPSDEAAALLANGGIVPGSLTTPEPAVSAPAPDAAAPATPVVPEATVPAPAPTPEATAPAEVAPPAEVVPQGTPAPVVPQAEPAPAG